MIAGLLRVDRSDAAQRLRRVIVRHLPPCPRHDVVRHAEPFSVRHDRQDRHAHTLYNLHLKICCEAWRSPLYKQKWHFRRPNCKKIAGGTCWRGAGPPAPPRRGNLTTPYRTRPPVRPGGAVPTYATARTRTARRRRALGRMGHGTRRTNELTHGFQIAGCSDNMQQAARCGWAPGLGKCCYFLVLWACLLNLKCADKDDTVESRKYHPLGVRLARSGEGLTAVYTSH